MGLPARSGGLLLIGMALLLGWLSFHSRDPARSAPIISSQIRTGLNSEQPPAGARLAQAGKRNPSPDPQVELPDDSPSSSDPVERAVSAGTVLDQRLVRQADGTIRRTRLVRSAIQPRLLRVEESWSREPPRQQWVCHRREMFLADQLILKVRPQVSPAEVQAALTSLGMDLGSTVAPDIFTVRLREADLAAMDRALDALSANESMVEQVEADGVGFGGGIPNDPKFGEEWGFHNTGQSGGTVDADVDAPELWDILGTTPGIVVAVLDSGLNFTHPDLQGIAWTNSAEIAGDGLDNDGNGRVDDVCGWDFTNGDNDPTDDHGHGSSVSGIIAANRNNGIGIAGMLNGVKILVCKVLNANNTGTTSALIAATTYARQMGVPIMNLSLQNYPYNSTLNSEFNACQAAGILLCICAGNQGRDNDVTPNYPSCYPQTNIVAVGNHDRTDVRWSGSFNPSNYGLMNVDLFAPGRTILSTVLTVGYSYYTGTSQATPFVTATAAAIKSVNPDWTAPQIRSAILNSVVTRPSYSGICVTGGRLNALASVANAIGQQPGNDTDGDHEPNLLEYLAGTRVDDSASQPVVSHRLDGGLLHLEMNRVVRPEAHPEVERSTNLVDWTTVGVTDFSITNLLDGAIPIEGDPLGFLRIRAVSDF